MNKPYFITSLGMNEGVFVRAGAHTVKANNTMLQELIWKNKGFAIDEIPVHAMTPEDINKDKFKSFLQEHRNHIKAHEINDLLFHYKILIDEHKKTYPTLGGTLLFGKIPQNIFSEAFIICSHFRGISGRNVIATIDCNGDLFTQLNTAIEFILTRINKQFVITQPKRKQTLEIPEIALREILINAIVHRDYYLSSPIKIAIYDDRVEIFSPGNFPGPLKINQLESGITYIRNHVICKVFREAGYIEKLGSGFLTLFQSYRDAGLTTPEVIEGTGFVKCILPRTKRKINQINEETNDIIRLFYLADEITTKVVAIRLGVSRQTAVRRLSELVKEGKLEMIGKGKSISYKRKNLST